MSEEMLEIRPEFVPLVTVDCPDGRRYELRDFPRWYQLWLWWLLGFRRVK